MSGWQLGLIDSAWFGSEYEGLPGLFKAKEMGFDFLDLFIGYDPGQPGSPERADTLSNVAKVNVPIISLVCTSLGLNDFNASVRQYHVERAKSIIDLGVELGTVRNLLFVPGEYMFQSLLLPKQLEWDAVVDATREVGEHAARNNLELAIELLPFPHAFVNSIESFTGFLDAVDLPNVKAAIDISHLWLIRADPSELRRLEGRVGHVHLADCDGEHHGDLPPGHGTTPFADYLAVLKEIGFCGGAAVELEFPADPSQMLPWVEEAYRTSAELLSNVGVRTSHGSST